MFKVIAIILLLLSVISCNISSPTNNCCISAVTNTTSYSGITNIDVTLKNETDRIIYLTHCGGQIGKYLERYDSTWTEAGDIAIVCLAIYASGSVPFQPGQTIKDTIIFSNPSGKYRLKYPYSFKEDQESQGYILSNKFNYINPR